MTIPQGPLRELLEQIRTPGSAAHALAVELWGYDPADGPASRVVMDMVFLGAGQLQVELDAESYRVDAEAHDGEREAWVSYSAAQLATSAERDDENSSANSR